MLELHIDLSRSARTAARADNTLTQSLRVRPEFVLRDTDYPVRLYLYDENGDPTTITEEQILALAGKSVSEYTSAESGNLFFLDTFTLDEESGYYSGSLNLNTTEFIAAMQGRRRIDLVVEVELQGPGEKIETVVQVDAIGVHDVHRGDEGEPVDAGPTLLTRSAADLRYFRASEDGTLDPEQLPDVLPARLAVLGGTAAELDTLIPVAREITVEEDASGKPVALRIGDGARAGGHRIGMGGSGESGMSIHVPATITMVSAASSGDFKIIYPIASAADDFGFLWWDNTITMRTFSNGDGPAHSRAVTEPSAEWALAPKLIRMFPAAGNSLRSLNLSQIAGEEAHLTALDWTGCDLEIVLIVGCPDLAALPPIPATVHTLMIDGTAIDRLDLGPVVDDGAGVISLNISNNPKLASIRAAGMAAYTAGPDPEEWDFSNNALTAGAINTLLADLPDHESAADLSLNFSGNPGFATADYSIATDKGYIIYPTP